jgi:hypothetical protein
VLLGDVHVATLPDGSVRATADNTDELLSWQALSLKGLKVSLKPNARPQVELREAELNDFFARLVVTEEGRLNLQEVVARAPGTPAPRRRSPARAEAPPARGNPGPARSRRRR